MGGHVVATSVKPLVGGGEEHGGSKALQNCSFVQERRGDLPGKEELLRVHHFCS